jgi:hypothetical protein
MSSDLSVLTVPIRTDFLLNVEYARAEGLLASILKPQDGREAARHLSQLQSKCHTSYHSNDA